MKHLVAAMLMAAVSAQSAAAPWQHAAESTYCEVSKKTADQKITYTFSSLLGEAGIELSSPKLKPYCNDSDNEQIRLEFASTSYDSDTAQVFCSADTSPWPTATILLGQLDASPAKDLANADAIKLELPAKHYTQTFPAAGISQAVQWLRQCVREHAAEWNAENSTQ